MNRLKEMEQRAQDIARRLKTELPKDLGFCLLIFDYGADGELTYISSAQRECMIKVLREAAIVIEHGHQRKPDATS